MKKIELLLPSIQDTKERKKMTDVCRKSLVSKDYKLTIHEDSTKYPNKVAQVWNVFLDEWRGKEYDYLFIVANDMIADTNAIDYMTRCLEDNEDSGMVTGKVIRNLSTFKKLRGKRKYTSRLTTGLIDPACFVLRKGVIEDIGRIDEYFSVEFVERDLIYRLQLAGYDVIQPDVGLWYHPSFSGTVGNDDERLRHALRRYISKWGGDAGNEGYRYPFNNMSLNYQYCEV